MLNETLNLFPDEIQKAIASLGDENRQRIVSVLMKKPEIAYTTLKDSLEFTKGNLNHHLSELIKAGLVTKYLRNKAKEPYESFYTISEFGRDLVNGIFEALKPSESVILPRRLGNYDREGLSAHLASPTLSSFYGLAESGGIVIGMEENQKPADMIGFYTLNLRKRLEQFNFLTFEGEPALAVSNVQLIPKDIHMQARVDIPNQEQRTIFREQTAIATSRRRK